MRRPPRSPLFPYTPLSRSAVGGTMMLAQQSPASVGLLKPALVDDLVAANRILAEYGVVDAFGHASVRHDRNPERLDRKSTRLNSSHSQISYAVFCLKKKKS